MSLELLVIFIVALIAFGPNKLPMLARHLGIVVCKVQLMKLQMATFWQQQLHESQLQENQQKAAEADRHYQLSKSSKK